MAGTRDLICKRRVTVEECDVRLVVGRTWRMLLCGVVICQELLVVSDTRSCTHVLTTTTELLSPYYRSCLLFAIRRRSTPDSNFRGQQPVVPPREPPWAYPSQ